MEVEPFLISSSLAIVIGQRLVRKICPYCQEEVEADDFIKSTFLKAGIKLEKYMAGKGCPHCFNTGYRGRIGIFEMLEITDNLRALINKRASSYDIKEEARKEGFRTMFEYGATLVEKGITTPSEVLSVTKVD